MECIKLNYEEIGRVLTKEEVEEFICYNLELLDENLFLTGYKDVALLYDKKTIMKLFDIINVKTILHAEYIHGSDEQEIKILLTNGRQVLLQIP